MWDFLDWSVILHSISKQRFVKKVSNARWSSYAGKCLRRYSAATRLCTANCFWIAQFRYLNFCGVFKWLKWHAVKNKKFEYDIIPLQTKNRLFPRRTKPNWLDSKSKNCVKYQADSSFGFLKKSMPSAFTLNTVISSKYRHNKIWCSVLVVLPFPQPSIYGPPYADSPEIDIMGAVWALYGWSPMGRT